MKSMIRRVPVTDWLLFTLLFWLIYTYAPTINLSDIMVTPFELVGMFGLGVCISAFIIKNDFYLRLCTVLGCTVLLGYYMVLHVPLAVFGNAAVIYLNVRRLEHMYNNRKLHADMQTLKTYAKEGKIKKITIATGETDLE